VTRLTVINAITDPAVKRAALQKFLKDSPSIAKALKADPGIAKAVAKAVAQTPKVKGKI
jgi:hypothetical protein